MFDLKFIKQIVQSTSISIKEILNLVSTLRQCPLHCWDFSNLLAKSAKIFSSDFWRIPLGYQGTNSDIFIAPKLENTTDLLERTSYVEREPTLGLDAIDT